MESLKKCTNCNIEKPFNCFYNNKNNKDKKAFHCKDCMKSYRDKNKEKIKINYTNWAKNNPDKIKEKSKVYIEKRKKGIYKNYITSIEFREKRLNYYYNNKEKILNKLSKRYSTLKNDPYYALTKRLRSVSRRVKKKIKSEHETETILGCSYSNAYNRFKNKNKEGTHIDHIIPLSWATNEEELIALGHYSNLQFLSAFENLSKSNKYCKKENLEKVYKEHPKINIIDKIIKRNYNKIC